MNNFIDSINRANKINELVSKQHDLLLKSITPTTTCLTNHINQLTHFISQINSSAITSSCQLILEQLHTINLNYQPIIESAIRIEQFIPKFDTLIKDISFSFDSINFEECSNEEKENLEIANAQLNEVKSSLSSSKQSTLTLEQFLLIITTILQLLIIVKDCLPDKKFEQLTTDCYSISSDLNHYSQQSLENQELYLENQEIQIENQEKMIELLENLQNSDKQAD